MDTVCPRVYGRVLFAAVTILVYATLLWAEAPATAPNPERSPTPLAKIEPDPKIQERLHQICEIVHTLSGESMIGIVHASVLKLQRDINDDQRLLLQAIYFGEIDPAPGGGERGSCNYLIRGFLQIGSVQAAEAVLPFLESPDPTLKRVALRALEWHVEPPHSFDKPDFTPYMEILRSRISRGEPPPPSLIRYMYRNDPAQAMRALMGTYSASGQTDRPLIWAEHVISEMFWRRDFGALDEDTVTPEARAEMAGLVRHPGWWARLYAAVMMREHPEFREPEVVELLRKDDQALVREAIDAPTNEELDRAESHGDSPPSSQPNSKDR